MRDLKIIIIGAGIGGLAAALALLRARFEVEVFEASPELGEIGAGLSLGPNCTRLLTHLGLDAALEDRICLRTRGTVRNGATGELLLKPYEGGTTEDRFGSPYYFVHRADLHGALVDAVLAADPSCIHAGRTFTAFEAAGPEVEARFADGGAVAGDLLVGCDGIRSAVRARLFGADAPRFTGNVAWRGLVPMAALEGVTERTASGLWVGSGRHIVYYPVRGHTLMNYVAAAETSGWEVEDWNVRSEVSELLAAFDDWHEDARNMIAATPPDLCYKWALFDRDPLDAWSRGPVTLLGDAAHPMLPFLGQGASMAVEDAVVLGRCLAKAGDVGRALASYETARKDRANWVVRESRESGRRLHRKNVDPATFDGDQVMQGSRLFPYDAATAPV